MVLSQPEIRAAVETGELAFDPPLEPNQWGEASVDLRLDFNSTSLVKVPGMKLSVAGGLQDVSRAGFWKSIMLPPEDALGKRPSLAVAPGEFVLGFTHEKIKIPRTIIGLVEGRSTYARVGLSMHQTAPWIQPGWSGRIVLEIMNNGPNTVELTPLIDRPCQLAFLRLTSELPASLAYGARPGDVYQDQAHPIDPKRPA